MLCLGNGRAVLVGDLQVADAEHFGLVAAVYRPVADEEAQKSALDLVNRFAVRNRHADHFVPLGLVLIAVDDRLVEEFVVVVVVVCLLLSVRRVAEIDWHLSEISTNHHELIVGCDVSTNYKYVWLTSTSLKPSSRNWTRLTTNS